EAKRERRRPCGRTCLGCARLAQQCARMARTIPALAHSARNEERRRGGVLTLWDDQDRFLCVCDQGVTQREKSAIAGYGVGGSARHLQRVDVLSSLDRWPGDAHCHTAVARDDRGDPDVRLSTSMDRTPALGFDPGVPADPWTWRVVARLSHRAMGSEARTIA